MHICIYICVFVRACARVCVCVRARVRIYHSERLSLVCLVTKKKNSNKAVQILWSRQSILWKYMGTTLVVDVRTTFYTPFREFKPINSIAVSISC